MDNWKFWKQKRIGFNEKANDWNFKYLKIKKEGIKRS